jgi:hypothetical protein
MYMSSKYILNILENNEIKNIILMDGKITKNKFDKGGFEYLDTILTLTEPDKSKLQVSEQFIHLDDTIDNLKKKIVLEYNKEISTDMIYLFYLTKKDIILDNVFSMLTQKRTIDIDKNRLLSFLQNIVDISLDEIEDKETYTYEDLLKLNIYGEHIVKVPLGLSYNIEDKYPFTVNPYDIVELDPFLETYSTNIVSTQNKNVLIDYDILDNNIYVCFCPDILENGENTECSLIKIYFPFLSSYEIESLEQLQIKKNELIQKETIQLGESFINNNDIVDMFYDIYNTRQSELDKEQSGIKELHFIIHPKSEIVFPIDIIFKIFKTSTDIPLTKYNTGNRSEKLYRLYSPDIATSGKKIPYLKKSKLLKLVNLVSREKSIGIYFEDENNIVILEFYINGNIKVKYVSRSSAGTKLSHYKHLLNLKDLEDYLVDKISNILEPINFYIQKSGYKNIQFTGFDKNIEIVDLQYTELIKIQKKINIKKYINCLSLLFVFLETELTDGLEFDYKRVSHFNNMNSVDKFISRQLLKNNSKEDLLIDLVESFKLERDEAVELLEKFLSNIEVEQNLYRNRRLKIKTSSGFPIKIKKDKYSDTVIVDITNISNVKYIEIILIYIDSLLRIMQDIKSTEIDTKIIHALCKKKYREEKDVVDIATVSEVPELQTEVAIDTGKLVFDDTGDDEDDDGLNFLNDMYGIANDGDDDEDDDIMGDLMNLTALDDDEEEPSDAPAEDAIVESTETDVPVEEEPEEDLTIQDGMPLNNPNYFFERMYRRDPKLFLKRKDGKYEAYSRMCPGHWRRQPVIVTQEEKDKIDKESPGSYGEGDVASLKYSSDPSKNYHYICPRYWCLKTNMSMTQEQVDAGECGGKIIPYDAKKVPKDTYIYEFNAGKRNNEHIDKEGNYMQHYPGFLKLDSHPDGLCVPCCIKNPNGNSQKTRRRECALGKFEVKPKKSKKRGIQRLYVKDMNKFPLDERDIAYLPLSVQKMLNVDNEKCRVSKKNNALISNKPCLLRKGLNNKIQNQSFLYAIADMLDLTLPAFKKQVLNKLSITDYMKLQNGALVDIFYDEKTKEDLSLIKDDSLKHIDKEFVLKVNKSFVNYRKFIMDNDIEINYTYTWDLITNIAFEDKKNMIILELLEDDLTDNIDLICPTNHFSNDGFFDSKKHSIILIKKDIFYYPVYLFINDRDSGENEIEIFMKQFSVFDARIGEDLKRGLMNIKSYLTKCNVNLVEHEKYLFKENIHHIELLKMLKKHRYKIIKQIVNYDGKKIALFLQTPNKQTIYVPSNVSQILDNVDMIDMNELTIRSDLKTSVKELMDLSKLGVPSKPVIKVKEDGMIVGIITETNQFVPLIRPEEDVEIKSIETKDGVNTIDIDTQLMLKPEEDIERKKIIKKINIETQFYNTFRNTFRILINQSENIRVRNTLKEIIETYDLYLVKLEKIIALLVELLSKYVRFTIYEDSLIDELSIIKPCVGLDDCEELFSFYDAETTTCKLLIPNKNLINDYDNEDVYYKRLADELIRYVHMHKYYFNKNTHISLDEINYNLEDYEIILLENLLVGDYFINIDKLESNIYTQKGSVEYINPNIKKEISNVINLKREKTLEDDDCILENISIGPTEKWHSLFEKKTKILKVKQTPECMFTVLINIINNFKKTTLTTKELKETLISQYGKYLETFKKEILETLKIQGKTDIISRIKRKDATLDKIITLPDYYLTNLDLIILFKKYKIPVVFISATTLKENNKSLFVVNYSPDTRYYYVIKQYGIVLNKVQKYGVLIFNKNIQLDLISLDNELSDSLSKNILESPFIKKKKKIKLMSEKPKKRKIKLMM